MTTTPDYKGVICVNESINIQKLSEYGMIAPDGTWYPCEFGEHAALAGRIIMQNRIRLNLSDKEVLDMAYDWSGKVAISKVQVVCHAGAWIQII